MPPSRAGLLAAAAVATVLPLSLPAARAATPHSGAVVSGRLVDATGRPVRGATVHITGQTSGSDTFSSAFVGFFDSLFLGHYDCSANDCPGSVTAVTDATGRFAARLPHSVVRDFSRDRELELHVEDRRSASIDMTFTVPGHRVRLPALRFWDGPIHVDRSGRDVSARWSTPPPGVSGDDVELVVADRASQDHVSIDADAGGATVDAGALENRRLEATAIAHGDGIIWTTPTAKVPGGRAGPAHHRPCVVAFGRFPPERLARCWATDGSSVHPFPDAVPESCHVAQVFPGYHEERCKRAPLRWISVDLGRVRRLAGVAASGDSGDLPDIAVDLSTDGRRWRTWVHVSASNDGRLEPTIGSGAAWARFVRYRADDQRERQPVFDGEEVYDGRVLTEPPRPPKPRRPLAETHDWRGSLADLTELVTVPVYPVPHPSPSVRPVPRSEAGDRAVGFGAAAAAAVAVGALLALGLLAASVARRRRRV